MLSPYSWILFFAALMGCKSNGNVSQPKDAQKEIRLRIPNHPLETEQDLDILLEEIGDARIVLLGEASHGTSEYYTWRAAISKRLIEEKGFDFIAVEGEWADSYRVNEFIKGAKQDSSAVLSLLKTYNRWPTWMWGNYEVAGLINWLNHYNQSNPIGEKAGFFGLDVYCLWESMTEVMPYLEGLEGLDPAVLRAAKKVHECFLPYSADPQQYALAVSEASANCRGEINRLWKQIKKRSEDGTKKTEKEFVMEQNLLVALNGENYYRTMVTDDAESWNIRDRHMMQTLERLLEFHGSASKAIVWAHNTHIGDARYTDMAAGGMINIGQLAREKFGEENVFAVGFGSYQGSVIASGGWGGPITVMEMPEATAGSWEHILHELSPQNKLIFSKDIAEAEYLEKPIGHRAVGVVYNPALEHFGNYVPTIIPKRYDAFLFVDQSKALHPLETSATENEPPDLYPWGF